MEHYLVTWDIDIDADSPKEAAEKALVIQRDPESVATVFRIEDDDRNSHTVDLDEEPVFWLHAPDGMKIPAYRTNGNANERH
jgi:hypothetical protein